MRWLTLVLVLFLAGCGTQWFPSDNGSGAFSNHSSLSKANAPDSFFFASDTTTTAGTPVQSAAVSISGAFSSGWPVTVSDLNSSNNANNSKIVINGTTFLATASNIPTVKPGDSIAVIHDSAASGQVSVIKVTIGAYATTYTTTTTSASADAPNSFFFTSDVSAEAVPSGAPTLSNEVTLAGTAMNGSWPVTVENVSPGGTDNASSVLINGTQHFVGESGVTAKPGDLITVVHNASVNFNGISVTKLTIGGYVTTYTTTTVPIVDAPAPDAFIKNDGSSDTTRTIAPDTYSISANAGSTFTISEPITLSGNNLIGWSFAVRDLTGFGGTFLTVNGETSYPSDTPTSDLLHPWQTFRIQHDIGGRVNDFIRTRVVIGNYSTVYQTKIIP